ncbi:PAS domain S-box protein [Natrialbaceae archaeon A-gly3]
MTDDISLPAGSVLDAIPEAIVLVEPETRKIVGVNDAATELFGRSRTRLLGCCALEVHPERTWEDCQNALFEPGRVDSLDDGSPIVVETPGGYRHQVEVATERFDHDGEKCLLWRYRKVAGEHYERERRKDLFEKVQEMADVGGWEYNVDSGEMWRTEHMYDLYDLSADDTPSLAEGIEFFHPEDRRNVGEAFERAIEHGEPYDIEARIVTADGETKWVRTKAEPQYENGAVTRVRGAIQDVTGRKEREKELEHSRERLQVLFDKSPDVIIVHDVEGRVLDINEKHAENLGYTREELLSMDVTDFEVGACGEDLERIWAEMDVGSRREVLGAHQRKDGSAFPVEVWLNKLEIDGQERILAVSRDITERKQREQDLARFRRAIESAGHAIFLTERDGTITYVNPAFEEITGYTASEAIGEQPRILSSGEMSEAYYEEQWTTILSGELWEELVVNQRKSGELYHAHQTIAPITDDDGEVVEFVAIQTDITERKEREQQLNTLDRVLRHNLRNELNVVEGHAEVIQNAGTDAIRGHAERILVGAKRLLETAEKGRKVTRILSETPHLEPLDVATVVEQKADGIRTNHPTATVEVDAPERAMVAASDRIGEAITELLENAVGHSDRPDPTVTIDVRPDEETVRIRIADDGPGIPAMERTILEETRKEEDLYHGSGLGLWFVHWVVRRSHGNLAFEENEPHGSVVTIELDRALSAE